MKTINEINEWILEFEPTLKYKSAQFRGYQYLLSLPLLGPFKTKKELNDKVAVFTGIPFYVVRDYSMIAVKNKVVYLNQKAFLDHEIYTDGVGLALGCGLLMGWFKRTQNGKEL